MVLVTGIAFLFGNIGVILLFYCVSFYALREFMTPTPTRRSDYPALVAAFYFALPMQYLLITLDSCSSCCRSSPPSAAIPRAFSNGPPRCSGG